MTKAFGTQLRLARRNCSDPERGGHLSQERFAELISLCGTREGFPTPGTVSSWECGRSQPGHHDRETLCAMLAVLLKYGGLANQDALNSLLATGGYAALSEEELKSLGVALHAQNSTGQQSIVRAEMSNGPVVSGGTQREPATLVVIRHQSMEIVPQKAVLASLSGAYPHYRIIEVVIDQCDLFHGNKLSDPREASRRQAEIARQIAELLIGHPEAEVVYYGIAHIPLHFLAGFQISNREQLTLFDFDRHRRTWDQLQRPGDMAQLRVSGLPPRVRPGGGDVVVRVSIVHRVTAEVIAEVIPSPMASIHLALKQPRADVVTSEQHIREYGRIFRQTMDAIHERLPEASGIHVFFAGPASLAFYCGQLVSKTIHPRVIVYNYTGQDVPRYSWGLDLTRDINAPDFLVQPGHERSE
jgi:transcriptional regulator with XRE-family HTH domain